MTQPCQLDNYKQHILVRKRWADTDLEFFPGFNLHVRWVENLGLVNFCLFTSLVFNWRLHLLTSRCRHPSCLITSTCHVGSRDIRFLCACANDLRTSNLSSSFSALLFSDYCLIYVFIYSISYEPFSYVTSGSEGYVNLILNICSVIRRQLKSASQLKIRKISEVIRYIWSSYITGFP